MCIRQLNYTFPRAAIFFSISKTIQIERKSSSKSWNKNACGDVCYHLWSLWNFSVTQEISVWESHSLQLCPSYCCVRLFVSFSLTLDFSKQNIFLSIEINSSKKKNFLIFFGRESIMGAQHLNTNTYRQFKDPKTMTTQITYIHVIHNIQQFFCFLLLFHL